MIRNVLLFLLLGLVLSWDTIDQSIKPERRLQEPRSTFDSGYDGRIFWDNKTEDDILDEIRHVEEHLKIYVYPVPPSARYDETSVHGHREILHHFKTEYLIKKYFEDIGNGVIKLHEKDPRKSMVVSDPNQANAFLIAHDWIRYAKKNCVRLFDDHLTPIISNVVDNYPYYNRSNGKDHFFIAVTDRGPFCDSLCVNNENKHVLMRIFNASFIGNYGMDKQTFMNGGILSSTDEKYEVDCHRAGYDIVVPQLIQPKSIKAFYRFRVSKISHREFDSTFSGSDWFDRAPLIAMTATALADYETNHTERLRTYLDGSPDLTLKFRGYFIYCPCGFACWSQRLYEGLAHYTIPILISDGSIQPYERILDWRKFSVKMNLNTWFNQSISDGYRQQLRLYSDHYRQQLYSCWGNISMNPPAYISNMSIASSNYDLEPNDTWVLIGKQNRYSECGKVMETYIWKKQEAIRYATPWLDFNDISGERNAYRLLEIEIWCRVFGIHHDTDRYYSKICSRQSDFTARREYFR